MTVTFHFICHSQVTMPLHAANTPRANCSINEHKLRIATQLSGKHEQTISSAMMPSSKDEVLVVAFGGR